jgi:biotin--protein ligase
MAVLNQVMLRQVSTLTAAELLDGSWASEAALLVMPGGADLPYCNRLNGRGNTIIQGTAG